MKVDWFEMADLKKRSYSRATWIPLRSYLKVKERGEYGYAGYLEEYFGAVSIMLPIDSRESSLKYEWSDVNVAYNGPYFSNDKYYEAGTFEIYKDGTLGKYLVL